MITKEQKIVNKLKARPRKKQKNGFWADFY
jgi:hypothetical protein